jgi:mono/diheme cytochrome c family protein
MSCSPGNVTPNKQQKWVLAGDWVMEWHARYSAKFCRRYPIKVAVVGTHFLQNTVVLVMLIIAASSTSAAAQETGSIDAGREYAYDHCATCHAVEGNDMRSPNPRAAPFGKIVRTPGMNGRALTVWLSSVHKDMPDFIIEKNDMKNLIAFILSLTPGEQSRQ